MPIFAARRIADGLLGAVTDVPHMPSNLIERTLPTYGGEPEDWEPIMLTDMEAAQLPEQQNGASVYLNDGIIAIVVGFPADLAARQQANQREGFFRNKPITDIRMRKVTRRRVIKNG